MLREELEGPVIGIMEASLYAARMLGGRVGIVATSRRSKTMHEDAVRKYGLKGYFAGCESTGLAVLELETKPKEEVWRLMEAAATALVRGKGADCIALGCAGMTEMREKVEEVVMAKEGSVRVLDGVKLGVQFLSGLIREGLGTAKGGLYGSSGQGRKARGQDWL